MGEGWIGDLVFVGNSAIAEVDFLGLATLSQIQEMLNRIRQARIECVNCAKIIQFLNCMQTKVYKDLGFNNDQVLREAIRKITEIAGRAAKIPQRVTNGTEAVLWLQRLGLIQMNQNVEEVVNWLKEKGGKATKILGLLQSLGKAASYAPEKDGVGIFLELVAGFGPKGINVMGQWYAQAYHALLQQVNNLIYSDRTLQALERGAEWCDVDCECAEAMMSTAIGDQRCKHFVVH